MWRWHANALSWDISHQQNIMNSYSFRSRPVRYVRWTPNCSGGLSSRHEQVSKRDSCFQTYLLPGDNRPLTTPIGIIVRLPSVNGSTPVYLAEPIRISKAKANLQIKLRSERCRKELGSEWIDRILQDLCFDSVKELRPEVFSVEFFMSWAWAACAKCSFRYRPYSWKGRESDGRLNIVIYACFVLFCFVLYQP